MKLSKTVDGQPCWFEIASSDPPRSFAFYAGVFGWTRTDQDLGEMGTYSFLANGNGSIGALCGLPPDDAGPSRWSVYFQVANCDAAAERVAALGGTVVAAPFDVQGHGRMLVATDPGGAVFCLWQPVAAGGGEMAMFEDHAIAWVELATRDVAAAQAFYGALLGWTCARSTSSAMPEGVTYVEYAVGGTHYGGMLEMTKEWGDMPSHWAVYVQVPDVDATVARALELGGANPVPAFDAAGVGRIALIAEPTGAYCYVITMAR